MLALGRRGPRGPSGEQLPAPRKPGRIDPSDGRLSSGSRPPSRSRTRPGSGECEPAGLPRRSARSLARARPCSARGNARHPCRDRRPGRLRDVPGARPPAGEPVRGECLDGGDPAGGSGGRSSGAVPRESRRERPHGLGAPFPRPLAEVGDPAPGTAPGLGRDPPSPGPPRTADAGRARRSDPHPGRHERPSRPPAERREPGPATSGGGRGRGRRGPARGGRTTASQGLSPDGPGRIRRPGAPAKAVVARPPPRRSGIAARTGHPRETPTLSRRRRYSAFEIHMTSRYLRRYASPTPRRRASAIEKAYASTSVGRST